MNINLFKKNVKNFNMMRFLMILNNLVILIQNYNKFMNLNHKKRK